MNDPYYQLPVTLHIPCRKVQILKEQSSYLYVFQAFYFQNVMAATKNIITTNNTGYPLPIGFPHKGASPNFASNFKKNLSGLTNYHSP